MFVSLPLALPSRNHAMSAQAAGLVKIVLAADIAFLVFCVVVRALASR